LLLWMVMAEPLLQIALTQAPRAPGCPVQARLRAAVAFLKR
ncbi:TetR/AcrR family transcriptional regulator, partial [Morganella morganii]|nr:TetR/AcrR family transcriptional regulator [Morganella morganii]